MVQFKYIKIKNFRSIKDATLYFKQGVWRVLGSNNDTDGFDSNASGKSTALSALQQCLFNRTIFGTSVEDTNHKQSKTGYILETELDVDGYTYRIVNDRTIMKITIYKLIDGEFIDEGIRSIPQAISVIKNLISMDFNTFIATTYISHSTVIEMVEHFTSSALLKIVLNFDRLYSIDKVVKDRMKDSLEITRLSAARATSIQESISILDSFSRVNTAPLIKKLDEATVAKQQLLNGIAKVGMDQLSNQISKDATYMTELSKKLANLEKSKSSTTCPCCKQPIVVDINKVDSEISIIKSDLLYYSSIVNENQGTYTLLVDDFNRDIDSINSDIEHYKQAISVADYKNTMYSKYKQQADALRQEQAQIDNTLKCERNNQEAYQAIIDSIKSGNPLKSLITRFCKALNTYIDEFTPLVSINYLNIKASAKKNNIEFVVYDSRFKSEITMSELSGGEMMRVRIILLLSLLKAIQTITGISSNLLVFDEALDALDSSAGDDLANLFRHLASSHDKFIALVSHGNQLNSIEFDGYITAVKTNSVTTIIQD